MMMGKIRYCTIETIKDKVCTHINNWKYIFFFPNLKKKSFAKSSSPSYFDVRYKYIHFYP